MPVNVTVCMHCIAFVLSMSQNKFRTIESKGKRSKPPPQSMAQPMEIDQPNDGNDNFFIERAKEYEAADPYASKAWILTAKSLSPNNFAIQFAYYKQEKADKNYVEAAKCFSYILLTFQNQPTELRQEINQLMTALRSTDEKARPEHEFLMEMFQHIPYDVQSHILKTLKRDADNCLDYCQFVLLLMKKFSQMAHLQLVR